MDLSPLVFINLAWKALILINVTSIGVAKCVLSLGTKLDSQICVFFAHHEVVIVGHFSVEVIRSLFQIAAMVL